MNGDSKIESGVVHISKEKEITVVIVYDGEFCGNGTTSNYTIKKGTCNLYMFFLWYNTLRWLL